LVDASLAPGYSNGVAPHFDLDPDEVTTIVGPCVFNTDDGSIDCDGLALRLNVGGVFNGIGYERVAPTSPTCAGHAGQAAPGIGVFSFGSLEMAPGSEIFFDGRRAVGLVAVRTITFVDSVSVYGEQGGWTWWTQGENLNTGGPAAGVTVKTAEELAMGAAGGGGAQVGGAGGNCGQPTFVPPPQFEPVCGGSMGGNVGQEFENGGGAVHAEGGAGGGAILIAAGESISFTGSETCGLHANGGRGDGSDYGGSGGGAGGTILLESPLIDLGTCWVTANGGGGGAGGVGGDPNVGYGERGGPTAEPAAGGSGPDPGGAGGARDSEATAGADGEYGGGGGGAVGFVRIRTSDCESLPDTISPRPTCETFVQ
jgi:hypothetical protein